MADLAPEMEGSALGKVKLGKENVDFFVVPGEPTTSAQMLGEVPVPPKNIVVFKTREQTPIFRAARVAWAPVRGVVRSVSFVFNKIASFAFGWLKPANKPAAPQETPANEEALAGPPVPVFYPAGTAPQNFAEKRSPRPPTGPRSAHEVKMQQAIRRGG